MEVRASQISKILTERPSFDEANLMLLEKELQGKVEDYSRQKIDVYTETTGIKTLNSGFSN